MLIRTSANGLPICSGGEPRMKYSNLGVSYHRAPLRRVKECCVAVKLGGHCAGRSVRTFSGAW